ncbi:MAG: tRNA lysidine(34) synthetase TilS [Bacteroidales bacterium]|nr:tRNA lysidine(34) synthetase TilS [Bacteroidales bacterium]
MLLVAVSGGIDSMCLMEKVRLEGEPFAVAHCNFRLRGEESDADEALVRSRAAAFGVVCHVKSFDTAAYAARNKISIEMAARRLRYHWFGELCREHGYSAVAVAHNANDNAETLILNLLRGTGIKGLLGMKAEGFIPDPEFADIPLLRPLLGMTREEIEAFARENDVPWREDRTNAENEYKRNKIRNLVFPVFREINPSFVQTLNEDMKRVSDSLSYLESQGVYFPESVATLGRIRGRGPLAEGQWEGRRGEAPEDSGKYTPCDYTVMEEIWDGSKPVKQPQGELIMDADKAGEFIEGNWETGDWIKPLGAPGKKKLQDWFTDHHIPADDKPLVKLLKSASDPHHVLAICGFCIDHSVRVTSLTRRILRILPA